MSILRMEDVNKNGWRENFINKVEETEENLRKLNQSFKVVDKTSDHDIDYNIFKRGKEKNYGFDEQFQKILLTDTQQKSSSLYFDSEIVSEINNFIISQNKERLFQTKLLHDIQRELKEVKQNNIEEEIKDLLLKILSQKSLTNENSINCKTDAIIKNDSEFQANKKETSDNQVLVKKPIKSVEKDISANNFEYTLFENKISEFDKRLVELEKDFKNASNQFKSVPQNTRENDTPRVTNASNILNSAFNSENFVGKEFKPRLKIEDENAPITKQKFICVEDVDKLTMPEIPDISLILKNLNNDLNENIEKNKEHYLKAEIPKKILKNEMSSSDSSKLKAKKTVRLNLQGSENLDKITRDNKIRKCYERGKQRTLMIADSAFELPPLEHLIELPRYQI